MAVAIAAAITLGATVPSWAMPPASRATSVTEAASSMITDVRYRGYRGRYYRNNGAGVALGILGVAGAVAGAAAYGAYDGGPRYYRRGYYGGGPQYGYGPGYGYYGPY